MRVGLAFYIWDPGEDHRVDPAQIAIAWAIAKGTVSIIDVIKAKHVEGALSAADVVLSNQEIKDLEALAKATGVEIKGAWEKSI
ncbi:aldo/keto reductase [Lentibacillus sp. Marseille-P4043]|uniref:aldo/keto reductase n=1 Tax=Lentibacillus sp. Marseille-P4043 TaxID=2040293 RepID=UPI000D0BB165|nr:aldo/keto reductase [Lentibacillus sp. Marseille-P4043]